MSNLNLFWTAVIELQASGEENVFNNDQLALMLTYGSQGISQLIKKQHAVLEEHVKTGYELHK